MRALLAALPLLLVGCPKETEIIEIPGRTCLLRLNVVQPEGVNAFRSDRPGDEGPFSSLDLRMTRSNGEVVERRLLGSEAGDRVVRFADPVRFDEGSRFDLELLVRSPSGAVYSLGRRADVGCEELASEVTVDLPVVPVNRWVTLPAPQVQRFEHESVSVGAGALFVGGRTTPWRLRASPPDAGPPQDAGSGDAGQADAGPGDAQVALDGGVNAPADAGISDVGGASDTGSVGDAGAADAGLVEAGSVGDAGATDAQADAGNSEAPGCEPLDIDRSLGAPVQNGVVYFERYRMRFVDRFETESRRQLSQIPRLMGVSLFHQVERNRVMLLGGLTVFGDDFCDPPPAAQFHIFDYSEQSQPRLTSLTWGEDQRESHFALQRLVFPRAVPVEHDLMDVVLLGGYWGRPQEAPGSDWPPRHDPPAFEMPDRMAVVNASNLVSRRDNLGSDTEIRLPFQPGVAAFGDGSALLFGGWAVDRQGITEPSSAVYQLLRSNTAANIEIEAPHIYPQASLDRPRAQAQGFAVRSDMVLVAGGLDAPVGGAEALELYRWRSNGRRGFREGGSLEHLPVEASDEAAVWDRGFAAVTVPCEGAESCPVLVVGGEDQRGVASDRALFLRLNQVDEQGQLRWRVEAEPLDAALPEPRWGASVNILDDGSYLVVGGRTAPPGSPGEPAQTAFMYLPYSP